MIKNGVLFLLFLVTGGLYIHGEELKTTHRVFQFENEHVRVWKTVIMPHQPLSMHRHDCARVVVGLKGGSLTKIEETGEVSELKFETGSAYWLTEDPPGTLHGDINESDEPIEVMVIEIKALEKR
jgi:quercetin dioxygenase-like cupin family protein